MTMPLSSEPPTPAAEAAKPGLLQRAPLRRFLRRAVGNWLERHQLPFNRRIHFVGIPLALAGVVLLFFEPWYWGVGALVGGYLLQYIGHAAEGNDVGEWAGIKRLFGLPYVGIAPRWQKGAPDKAASGPD
jgi:hypothetical protein